MGGHIRAGRCANRSSGKGAFKPDHFMKKIILSSISIASSHVATDLRFSRTDSPDIVSEAGKCRAYSSSV
jgi:hypothetical protein